MSTTNNHREELLGNIANIIETTGQDDADYQDKDKALDILMVLESLLGYTIYTSCLDEHDARDLCEESYVNIKRRALNLLRNETEVQDEEVETIIQ